MKNKSDTKKKTTSITFHLAPSLFHADFADRVDFLQIPPLIHLRALRKALRSSRLKHTQIIEILFLENIYPDRLHFGAKKKPLTKCEWFLSR